MKLRGLSQATFWIIASLHPRLRISCIVFGTARGSLTPQSQALFIQADRQRLKVAAIDARDWRSIASLGWEWLTGDWVAASAVREVRARTLRIAERRPVLALFDGEPVMLDGDQMIGAGLTERQFIRTV